MAAPILTPTGPPDSRPPRIASPGHSSLHPFLTRDADGSFVVPWETIAGQIQAVAWDVAGGERNHVLYPRSCATGCGGVASIYPAVLDSVDLDVRAEIDSAIRKLSQGQFVARIESFGDFAPLGLRAGDNYLFVWRLPRLSPGDGQLPGKPTHMMVLNSRDRTVVAFEFIAHGAITQAVRARILGHQSDEMAKLSVGAIECVNNHWRACFVDSPTVQQYRPGTLPAGWFGVGFTGEFPFRPPLFSQPWVSCAQFGCCCGGTSCHI